jgi:uncharacterized membrane protein
MAEATKQVEDTATGAAENGSGGGRTITSELKDTFRDAAIEVLTPVLRKATVSAAKYAVTEGPSLVKDKVGPKISDAGGVGAIAKGAADKGGGVAETVGGLASKLTGKKKEGESPSGTGRGRRLPVQECIEVGVDLQTAYDQFTQFEDWPKFMHRVERIEQRDDATLMWHENIWGVRRSWEVEITDQKPCERIAWRSKGGTQTIGVVTFHRISDNLTRIWVTNDFQPKGLFEKTASGTRISRRALKSDLMRFKAFIEVGDEATGGWHGTIEDGEVVDEGEERDDERRDDDEYEDDEDEPRAEDEEDEPRAEDEEYEEEDDEEEEPDEEEEEAPKSRSRRRRRSEPDEDEEDEAVDEDEDEDAEEAPRPRRRRRKAATAGR